MKKKSLTYATCCGTVLYSISIFVSYIPYKEWDDELLALSMFLGIIIGFWIAIYRNNYLKTALFRAFVLFFTWAVLFGTLGGVGFHDWLDNLLNIVEDEATGRASGLGIVFLILFTCVGWTFALFILIIKKIVFKVKSNS